MPENYKANFSVYGHFANDLDDLSDKEGLAQQDFEAAMNDSDKSYRGPRINRLTADSVFSELGYFTHASFTVVAQSREEMLAIKKNLTTEFSKQYPGDASDVLKVTEIGLVTSPVYPDGGGYAVMFALPNDPPGENTPARLFLKILNTHARDHQNGEFVTVNRSQGPDFVEFDENRDYLAELRAELEPRHQAAREELKGSREELLKERPGSHTDSAIIRRLEPKGRNPRAA